MDYSAKIEIQKLKGKENWDTWKYNISALLDGTDGASDAVNGTLTKPVLQSTSGGAAGDAAQSREKGKDLLFKDSNKSISSFGDGDEMEYWAGRLEQLKKEHREINEVIETEYEKTLEISNKLFEKPPITEEKIKKVRPCCEYRNKIMQCYEENSHQPLVCSPIVQAFSSCVSSCQEELLE